MNFLTDAARTFLKAGHRRGVIHLVILQVTLLNTITFADDSVRWFTFDFPEFQKNVYQIAGTEAIKAFASEDNSYDVTLIDNNGGMVRLDTATGQHWEILPVAFDPRKPSTHVPFFQLINDQAPTQYLGRIYYQSGSFNEVVTKIGQQRVMITRSTPYPVKGGFRGLLVNSRRKHHLLFGFRADPRFENGMVVPINLGEFQHEFTDSAQVSDTSGHIERRAARTDVSWTVSHLTRENIACLPLTGDPPFAFGGYSFRTLQLEWKPRAVVSTPAEKRLVMIYDKALIQLENGRRVVPFPGGYSLRSFKSLNEGATLTALMDSPDSTCELWSIDTATLNVLDKCRLPATDSGVCFDESGGIAAVQSKRNKGSIFVYERQNGVLTEVGRTSPMTDIVGRAESWALSDDGKMLFFIAKPSPNDKELKFGWVSVNALRFRKNATEQAPEGGLDQFSQKNMTFEQLPAGATAQIVGILPPARQWQRLSPNDRWVAGKGDEKGRGSGLLLFDTASQKCHFIPQDGSDIGTAFSSDSTLLALFSGGRLQVWNVAGATPFMVASTDTLPRQQSQELRPVLLAAYHGACFVSQDSVATTNHQGSVRFHLNGTKLELVMYKSELSASPAAYSEDGNTLAIWKGDGEIWQYAWDGTSWKGNSKTSVAGYSPFHHGQAKMCSMDSDAQKLVIYSNAGLTIWNDLSNTQSQPLTTIGQATDVLGLDMMMDCTAISENQNWIVSVKENELECVLSLWDRNLKKQKTHRLPLRFPRSARSGNRGHLLVTNDGRHALIRDADDNTYIIRL